MAFLDTAYHLGVEAALRDFEIETKHALDISAGTGAPMPSQMPTSGTGNPVQQPTQGSGRPSPMPTDGGVGSATKLSQDFFGALLERGDDNPTDAPRKTAAEYAVEKALEKLGEPRGHKVKPGSRKGGRSEPASHAPAGKGTRFKALKAKLSRKKGVKDPGALAAAIGRSKFGKGGFQHMAAKGR